MEKTSSQNAYFSNQNGYNQGEYSNAHLLFENLDWLTTDDAARFLRKTTHALRQMTYKKVIRARKLGGRLYFKKSELDQLLDTSFF